MCKLKGDILNIDDSLYEFIVGKYKYYSDSSNFITDKSSERVAAKGILGVGSIVSRSKKYSLFNEFVRVSHNKTVEKNEQFVVTGMSNGMISLGELGVSKCFRKDHFKIIGMIPNEFNKIE